MKGFIDFVRSQGVMGLVIGFMLGGSLQKVVSAFVNSVVNPFIGILLGNFKDLGEYKWTIAQTEVQWGNFVVAVIDFVIIAAVVYFVFKRLRFDRIEEKGRE